MGSSFSWNPNYFGLRLVQNVESELIKNADEIMDAIKDFRQKIKYRIEELEKSCNADFEVDREIAVLIRHDKYLRYLESKHKTELEEIFFSGRKKENNCIYPDVLQWYQPPAD